MSVGCSDAELIILQSFALNPVAKQEFAERHQAVMFGTRTHLNSTQEEVDQAAVHATYRQKLRDLGLLETSFKQPTRGGLPEFDPKTGMIKAKGAAITPLGRVLLRYLDLTVER